MAVPGPVVFPGELVAVRIAKAVNQGAPVIGNIGGQGGHVDIEGLEGGEGQGRVEKCAAKVFFLGGASAPLAGTGEADVTEGGAQFQPQKYRVVVCRAG